jgi:hypothetical protein
MIEHPEAEERARFPQTPRERQDPCRWFRLLAGMVVNEDDGRRIPDDRGLENLSGMHEARGQRADGNDIDADHLVLARRRVDDGEYLREVDSAGREGGRLRTLTGQWYQKARIRYQEVHWDGRNRQGPGDDSP